jgi:hypothetical protein
MYKGLKKKYSREEYVKLTLTKNKKRCYFCKHNIANYQHQVGDNHFYAAEGFFADKCLHCIHKHPSREPKPWMVDNFMTLYDWEKNTDEGES